MANFNNLIHILLVLKVLGLLFVKHHKLHIHVVLWLHFNTIAYCHSYSIFGIQFDKVCVKEGVVYESTLLCTINESLVTFCNQQGWSYIEWLGTRISLLHACKWYQSKLKYMLELKILLKDSVIFYCFFKKPRGEKALSKN